MSFSEFNTYQQQQQELGEAKKVKLMYTSGMIICLYFYVQIIVEYHYKIVIIARVVIIVCRFLEIV